MCPEAYLRPSGTTAMKLFVTFTCELFSQNAPSQIFDLVVNTPLDSSVTYEGIFSKCIFKNPTPGFDSFNHNSTKDFF